MAADKLQIKAYYLYLRIAARNNVIFKVLSCTGMWELLISGWLSWSKMLMAWNF